MRRAPCCATVGLNRGSWTRHEDLRLSAYIQTHGEGPWTTLPNKAGLLRCGKSCRLRWKNYLRPDLKRGHISAEEEDLILRLHRLLGNRWTLIAGRIPGRTDNDIKNYWKTHLSKKLIRQGIDPRTLKPLSESPKVRVSSGEGDDSLNSGVDNVEDFGPSQESRGGTQKEDHVDQSKCNQIPEKPSHPSPDVMDLFQDQRTCITEPHHNSFINNSLKGSCQIISNVSCVSGNAPFDIQVMSQGLKDLGMEASCVSEMMPPSVKDLNELSDAYFEDPASGLPYPTTTTPTGSAYGDCSPDSFSSLLDLFLNEEYHFSDSTAYTTFL